MKKTIMFESLSLVANIFTLMILTVSIVEHLYGEGGQGLSTFFRLGNNGVSNSTVLEVFGLSLMIACLEALFFHSKPFEKMMMLWKTAFLILSVFIATIGFIIFFKWFPIHFFKGWLLFSLFFVGCSAVSMVIMVVKTKMENENYSRLLNSYKSKQTNQ